MTLIVRNVRPWGDERVDLLLEDGLIKAIAQRIVTPGPELDGRGATLLPGLHDHHLHILATAARRLSLDLAGLTEAAAVAAALRVADRRLPRGAWLRAVGFDERAGGLPDAAALDAWVADRPVKLQDRTGAAWVLNRAALLFLEEKLPPGCERDADGRPTGRFWREDLWLGRHLPRLDIDLPGLGRALAALGLTGLTDAGAGNGPDEAAVLASGKLPQALTIMGSEALGAGAGYRRGALKLLIDERDIPDVAALAARIGGARAQGRAVAAHCVTAAELALFLAALEAAGGARAGDRIEHGGEISADAILAIAATPLAVVTNPAFIHDRGDRYRRTIDPAEWGDLYRAKTLIEADIPLAAGSDSPYALVDPWLGMRAARDRQTRDGHALGAAERIVSCRALALYLGSSLTPGGAPRPVAPGAAADLVLCEGSLDDVLADLTAGRVLATICAGEVTHAR